MPLGEQLEHGELAPGQLRHRRVLARAAGRVEVIDRSDGQVDGRPTPQSTVTLTATPTPGSAFIGWSGACTGTGVCTVALPYDQNVIATFGPGGSVPATGGTPSVGGTAGSTVNATVAAAKCTLKLVSNKVLLAPRKGKARKGAPKPGTVVR